MIEFPEYVTAEQWAASPRAAQQDDEGVRGVALRYLGALFEALSSWRDRHGAAQWPEKYERLDDRLSYFSGKVKLALETADGPREVTSAVLAEFSCVPAPQDHQRIALAHTEVAGTGAIEVLGMIRREMPLLIAEVGAEVRARPKKSVAPDVGDGGGENRGGCDESASAAEAAS